MPKIEIEFTGTECFVVFDGTRIASAVRIGRGYRWNPGSSCRGTMTG